MSMSNYNRSFAVDIAKFDLQLHRELSSKLRKATINGFRSAITQTRVDTGTARLNWRVSLGDINTSTSKDPSIKPKKGQPPNTTEYMTSGMEAVSVTLKSGFLGNIYISNNLDYIGMLNWMDDYETGIVRSVEEGLMA